MWRKRVRAERKESRCGAIHDLQHGRRPAQAFLEDLRVGPRFLSRTQTLDAGEITRPSPPRMIRSHSIWMKMPRATRCSAALRRADGIRRRSRCGSFREYTDRRRRHRHERRTRVAEADAFRRYASGRKRNSEILPSRSRPDRGSATLRNITRNYQYPKARPRGVYSGPASPS